MIRDIRHYENRIYLMSGRAGRENGSVIRKCKRKIRQLQKQDSK